MATVTIGVATGSTTNASSYASASFTPVASDLLVAIVTSSGTTGTGSMTSTGNTAAWTLIRSDLYSTGSTMYLFVQNALVTATATVVTFATTVAATGAIIQVARLAGMTNTAAAAIKQTAVIANHAAANPLVTPTLGVSALTTNPLIETISGNESYSNTNAPAGWTNQSNTTYATPTTTQKYNSRNSGFTGTNSGLSDFGTTAYGMYLIEFDASAPTPPASTASTLLMMGI